MSRTRVLKLDAFQKGEPKNFNEFIENLAEQDLRIFQSKVVEVLFKFFRDDYSKPIKYFVFVPYLVKLSSGITFYYLLSESLKGEPISNNVQEDWMNMFRLDAFAVSGLTFLLSTLYLLGTECSQIYSKSLSYFRDWNNLMDLSMLLDLLILIPALLEVQVLSNINAWISVATFFLVMKSLYWSKLFGNLAYFNRVLVSSMFDDKVVYFLFFLLILMAWFGVPLFFLNNQKALLGEEGQAAFIEQRNGGELQLFDLFIHMYMLSLGDFGEAGNMNESLSLLNWGMFLLATFFIQVMMMNVLIALMGETYSAVTESIQASIFMENVGIIRDYLPIISMVHKISKVHEKFD